MEGPLYGETTKQQKMLLYGTVGALGLLTVVAIGCAIGLGVTQSTYEHFILIVGLVILTATIALFVCDHLAFFRLDLFFFTQQKTCTNSGGGTCRSTSTPSSSTSSRCSSARWWSWTLRPSSTPLPWRSQSPSSGLFKSRHTTKQNKAHPPRNNSDGFYHINTTHCYETPNPTDCGRPGYCGFFSGFHACCGNCSLLNYTACRQSIHNRTKAHTEL